MRNAYLVIMLEQGGQYDATRPPERILKWFFGKWLSHRLHFFHPSRGGGEEDALGDVVVNCPGLGGGLGRPSGEPRCGTAARVERLRVALDGSDPGEASSVVSPPFA